MVEHCGEFQVSLQVHHLSLQDKVFLDSSMVEHSAVNRVVAGSSPARGVWLHGQAVKTSPFHGGNTGSNPVGVIFYADVAQLAEQLICNQQVIGSSPIIGLLYLCIFQRAYLRYLDL